MNECIPPQKKNGGVDGRFWSVSLVLVLGGLGVPSELAVIY